MGNLRNTGYEYYAEGNTLRVAKQYPSRRKTQAHLKRRHGNVNQAAKLKKRPYAKGRGSKGSAADYITSNQSQVSKPHYAFARLRKVEPEAKRTLKALSGTISRPLTFLLVALVLLVLFFGFDYLRMSASIDEHMDNIKTLETRLETLKNQNDALEEGIDTSINLNEIYDQAVNRLGMVPAGEGSVITYDKTESEYVRQYDLIPSSGQ